MTGPLASDASYGNNGAFILPPLHANRVLAVIASDGMKWEHVSVCARESGKKARIPTWEEMCHVKSIFWDANDVVMQLHPRESEYVNYHASVLHLWRPTGATIPEPPHILVGPKESARA